MAKSFFFQHKLPGIVYGTDVYPAGTHVLPQSSDCEIRLSDGSILLGSAGDPSSTWSEKAKDLGPTFQLLLLCRTKFDMLTLPTVSAKNVRTFLVWTYRLIQIARAWIPSDQQWTEVGNTIVSLQVNPTFRRLGCEWFEESSARLCQGHLSHIF